MSESYTTVFPGPGAKPFAHIMPIKGKTVVNIKLDAASHNIMLGDKLTDAEKDAYLEEWIKQLTTVREALLMTATERAL